MRSDAPSGSPTQYTDPKTIDNLLKSSNPEAVAESGRSYQKFAAAYEKIAGELIAMRSDLHDAWGGQDAAAAQEQLREVWAAATTVHKTARTFGIAVERHGSESLAWYKNSKPPSKNLADAQIWMAGANERVSQSWGSLPPDLATTLPPGRQVDYHGPASGGSDSSRTTPMGAGTAGGGGGASGLSHHRSLGGGQKPSLGGSGSHLAGLPSSGSMSGMPGFGGGSGLPPDGTGGLAPGGTSLTSGGGSLSGSGIPGLTGPMGTTNVGGIEPGSPGSAGLKGTSPQARPGGALGSAAAKEAQAAEAGTAARAGMAGPMAGAEADRQERERTRQTWLAEEEDVWTGHLEATPQLIGAEESRAKEPESPTEIDLSDTDDVIADLLNELGGDEVKDTATEIAELRAKLQRLERQTEMDDPITAQSDDGTQGFHWITGEDR
jgi:hypothetical protein